MFGSEPVSKMKRLHIGIDELRQVPAAIRFISFEPLIGSVGDINLTNIDWAIVGGESGHAARPIKELWIGETLFSKQFLKSLPVFSMKSYG